MARMPEGWQAIGDGLPEDRDEAIIYAVVHRNHGVILARGNEVDWTNGCFTHWHKTYRHRSGNHALNIQPSDIPKFKL